MSFLLDTCVISEFAKPKPNGRIVAWLKRQPERSLYLSTVTVGEIQYGISRLPLSKRREALQAWLETDLMQRFQRRIVGIDVSVARQWGRVRAQGQRTGRPMPVVDSLIAAVAIVYDMTIVTRNAGDIERSGARWLDPWNPP